MAPTFQGCLHQRSTGVAPGLPINVDSQLQGPEQSSQVPPCLPEDAVMHPFPGSHDPGTFYGRRGLFLRGPPPQEASSSARRGSGFYVLCSKLIHKEGMSTQIDQSD